MTHLVPTKFLQSVIVLAALAAFAVRDRVRALRARR